MITTFMKHPGRITTMALTLRKHPLRISGYCCAWRMPISCILSFSSQSLWPGGCTTSWVTVSCTTRKTLLLILKSPWILLIACLTSAQKKIYPCITTLDSSPNGQTWHPGGHCWGHESLIADTLWHLVSSLRSQSTSELPASRVYYNRVFISPITQT